jgi:hypothetical protein
MSEASRGLPWAAAGGSIAVAIGMTVVGILMVGDGRSEPVDLAAVAAGAHRAELVRLAGGEPEGCVYAGPNRELCRWRIEGNVVGALDSPAGEVNLVCELPLTPDLEGAGDCFVGPRSLEDELPPVGAPGDDGWPAPSGASALAAARTVTDLSRLVGDGPDGCQTVYAGQLCRWRLATGSPGHARLGGIVPGLGDKELRCMLPLEGDDRPQHSCVVVEIN